MDSQDYLNLSEKEKKKLIRKAIRGANKDQRELVEKAKARKYVNKNFGDVITELSKE